MNNYAYLIKAKAKATDSRNLFCWFTAKSDSRAERKILDILEDAEINVGRGADHQLPIRTNWHIVDDLPEENVLDETWCDRYELGGEDGLTWQKIAAPVVEETVEATDAEDATNAEESEQEYANDENALFPVSTMPFRTQLLAQYMESDRHVYHISIPHRGRLEAMEMDQDNSAIQDLILAAENVPGIKKFDMPGIWKFTTAFKTVFPEGKRYEIGKQIQFSKLWFQTPHIERGILVKEWADKNQLTSVDDATSDASMVEGKTSDRLTPLTILGLEYEIALGLLARAKEFDIYNVPFEIDIQANGIMNKLDNKEWLATRELFMSIPGGRDFSRACNIAAVKTTPQDLWKDPVAHREYLNKVMIETDHAHPDELIVDIACGRSSSPMPAAPMSEPGEDAADYTGKLLAAGRGEYVEGISDPNDEKWVKEDLTKPRATAETARHVQMEEAINDENAPADEISKSETADEKTAGDAESGNEANTLNNDSGHHNIEESRADYVHVMVDLETMGKKSDAPIVSIGAVIFDPETGFLGEKFYKVVSLESAVSWGAEIDPSTVIWWMKQSSEARSEIANDNAIQLDDALLQFSEFVFENIPGGCETAQIWGNGATFDNTVLRSSFERACLDCPWDYRNDRDVRTMVELGKAIGFDAKTSIPFEGERHNALADAQHQARYVSAIWQRLIKN
ncbi:exonuclease [Klebsiella pneumoniae subsp. pneumoniae]|uniref:exonuclease n=1 Tax=Klebsiella TaxID=570 RepID=UPI000DA1E627|nr:MULTISPECIES: exonuclease [Klebsiella]MCD5660871.1 3'-5' exoribonuclease [Klebsiella pneumoniae]MCX3082794.1 3'-5' exoribonuclease [Klebsiella michiganensis]PZA44803.1 exonuclease [Klebsiella pneumoniae subsp. pneumoniae]PZA58289.1 exonuclease [Klebsiella pneumoniae subsp. pneumoniae]PZA61840.1 exonuclease [Klebsiella pneumoniae subsp. pneumoniae]